MLTVTIRNGDENSKEFWVNDLGDLKAVQVAITDEFQTVLAQDKSEEKIELERILDSSDFDNADDLIDWIHKMQEMESELDRTDYNNVGDLADDYERVMSSMSDIFYVAREYN